MISFPPGPCQASTCHFAFRQTLQSFVIYASTSVVTWHRCTFGALSIGGMHRPSLTFPTTAADVPDTLTLKIRPSARPECTSWISEDAGACKQVYFVIVLFAYSPCRPLCSNQRPGPAKFTTGSKLSSPLAPSPTFDVVVLGTMSPLSAHRPSR